jgi:mannosyltransferase OCH1-like enzyme
MQLFYADTSILWAFNMIHPLAGAFASDIWRYAVLYKFGGFYIVSLNGKLILYF